MNRFSHIYFYRLSIVIRGSWFVVREGGALYKKAPFLYFPYKKLIIRYSDNQLFK